MPGVSAEAEQMTDEEVVAAIRSHLFRTYIGPLALDANGDPIEVRVPKDDGTIERSQRRVPHRFVKVFDELVKRLPE